MRFPPTTTFVHGSVGHYCRPLQPRVICLHQSPTRVYGRQYYRRIKTTALSLSTPSNENDNQEEYERSLYIPQPAVSYREDLFGIPYVAELHPAPKSHFIALTEGMDILKPGEIHISDGNVTEEVDKFRFRLDVDQLERFQRGEQRSIEGSQVAENDEMSPQRTIQFDSSLLQALENAEIIDQGDTITYRLELDQEDFEHMVTQQANDDNDDSNALINHDSDNDMKELLLDEKNAVDLHYSKSKRLIRNYFPEFHKLATDDNNHSIRTSFQPNFIEFFTMIELPRISEVLWDLLSFNIIVFGAAAMYALFDYVILTGARWGNSFVVRLFAKFGYKIELRPDLLMIVAMFVVYPLIMWWKDRNPDLSFAGYMPNN